MPGVNHRDLSGRPGGAGNHVAGWRPKGIVLHVNDSRVGSYGTSIDWYAAGGGPDGVCPTWQVYPDGKAWQLLAANVQPWTQRAGNSWGVSIETGGNHAERLTPAAVATIARIVRWMHIEWGVPYAVSDTPAHAGLGTHQMGGAAWGGHPCPGTVRASQRAAIIAAARGQHPQEDDVSKADVIAGLEDKSGHEAVVEAVIDGINRDLKGADRMGLRTIVEQSVAAAIAPLVRAVEALK